MDGILVADKPAGRTSHDVVAEVRRGLGGRRGPKVGHAGTLDPFATGVLLVLVGSRHARQRWLMALEKEYVARARFGWTSTTGDPEGDLTETGRMPPEPLVLPTGVLRQRPHAYSAVKVSGRRAYTLARAGEEVELAEREITVHEFTRLEADLFRIRCSSGTYVRSLIADLGDAYCTELRRTAIGPFRVDDAGPELLPLGDVLARILPAVDLGGDDALRAAHGSAVPDPRPPSSAGHPVAADVVLLRDAGGPIALAEPRPGRELKPVVGFRA
jgi:tRNA pseudouridine55 synthase